MLTITIDIAGINLKDAIRKIGMQLLIVMLSIYPDSHIIYLFTIIPALLYLYACYRKCLNP